MSGPDWPDERTSVASYAGVIHRGTHFVSPRIYQASAGFERAEASDAERLSNLENRVRAIEERLDFPGRAQQQ